MFTKSCKLLVLSFQPFFNCFSWKKKIQNPSVYKRLKLQPNIKITKRLFFEGWFCLSFYFRNLENSLEAGGLCEGSESKGWKLGFVRAWNRLSWGKKNDLKSNEKKKESDAHSTYDDKTITEPVATFARFKSNATARS